MMSMRLQAALTALLVLPAIVAGCTSFQESVRPIITADRDIGAGDAYRQQVYMKGTRSINQVNPDDLRLDVWRIDTDGFRDSGTIRLFVRVFDTSGYLVTDLAPPYYKGEKDYRSIWNGIVEQVGLDGPKQGINEFDVREFSDRDGIPYELALSLDYSGSMGSNVISLQKGAAEFVRMKRSQDRVAVVKFDKAPNLVVPLTDSKNELLARFTGEPTLAGYGTYTALYSAAKLGSDQIASTPTGHPRALVLFTDGEDNASTIPAADLYEFNADNNIPTFSIGMGAANRDVLIGLSESTGGRFYQVYTGEELEKVFKDIYLSLRNFYMITYKAPRYGGRHYVSVALSPPNGDVQIAGRGEYTVDGPGFLASNADGTIDGNNGQNNIITIDPDFGRILFDFGKATLRPESDGGIRLVADTLRDNPRMILRIEGHTDSIGEVENNLVLSINRAEAVRQALIAEGIDPNRLQIKGYGKSRPITQNDTDEGRQKNRRVEFVVIRR